MTRSLTQAQVDAIRRGYRDRVHGVYAAPSASPWYVAGWRGAAPEPRAGHRLTVPPFEPGRSHV